MDSNASEDRPNQRAAPADDHPDDDLRRLRQAEDGWADEGAPVGEQAARVARKRGADREGRELVGARIVAEELRALFVLADADDRAAEPTGEQRPKPEIGQEERGGRKIEHALEIDLPILEEGHVQRGNARDAVEAAELRGADVEFGPGGRIDRIEEDQSHRQRDHAEVDVADAAVEHEIAEQRRKRRRNENGQNQRRGALADVDHRDRVSVGAKPEKRRLAETENASESPDEGERQGKHRHDHVDGDVEHDVEIEQPWRKDEHREPNDRDQREPENIESARAHRLPRKKRPVIP